MPRNRTLARGFFRYRSKKNSTSHVATRSHGHVGRGNSVLAKTRRRREAPVRRRAGKVHGTLDNQSATYSMGVPHKSSLAFEKKVRDVATNRNCYDLSGIEKIQLVSSQCIYFGSPLLFGTEEIYQMSYYIGNTANYTAKYLVENVSCLCQLVNSCDAQVNLRVYECQARQDIPAACGYPIALLNLGFTATGASNTKVSLASTAFQSPAFCSRFKIRSVRNMKINPGEEIRLTLRDNSCRLINMERYYASSTKLITGIAKYSRFLLFQAWGQVAAEYATNANLGTTANIINCVYTQRYTYKWSSDYTSTNFTSGTVTTAGGISTALSSLTTPYFFEEQTGTSTQQNQI